jgi:hypothetical protein
MMEQPLAGTGEWEVCGGISRHPARSISPVGPHPVSHWSASKDDEYRLTLSPVPGDEHLWNDFDAELVDPKIVANGRVIDLEWVEVVDARVDSLLPGYLESYVQYLKTQAPISYESEIFHLNVPPPDSLLIRVELRIRKIDTGQEVIRTPVSACVIKEKRRRWTIQDAIEL